jgi:hypothetical protein
MEKTGNLAAPSSKRSRRPRAEWLKEVRSLRDSGLSPEEYAAKKGLVLSTLKFWMRIFQNDVEARTKSEVPAFLPVSVLHAATTPSSDAAVMVEIDLANGRRLRMQVRVHSQIEGGNSGPRTRALSRTPNGGRAPASHIRQSCGGARSRQGFARFASRCAPLTAAARPLWVGE